MFKEVGNRVSKIDLEFVLFSLCFKLLCVQMVSLLVLVFEEDKVMKESDKVIEVEKERFVRIEKQEVILVLVEYDFLFFIFDVDRFVKIVYSIGRLRVL